MERMITLFEEWTVSKGEVDWRVSIPYDKSLKFAEFALRDASWTVANSLGTFAGFAQGNSGLYSWKRLDSPDENLDNNEELGKIEAINLEKISEKAVEVINDLVIAGISNGSETICLNIDEIVTVVAEVGESDDQVVFTTMVLKSERLINQ